MIQRTARAPSSFLVTQALLLSMPGQGFVPGTEQARARLNSQQPPILALSLRAGAGLVLAQVAVWSQWGRSGWTRTGRSGPRSYVLSKSPMLSQEARGVPDSSKQPHGRPPAPPSLVVQ